jgi:hypothetical protein
MTTTTTTTTATTLNIKRQKVLHKLTATKITYTNTTNLTIVVCLSFPIIDFIRSFKAQACQTQTPCWPHIGF